MDRIDKLCSYLAPCRTFADVGCDHGYCTRYMLKNRLCEHATVTDISAKCLEKAETLLFKYIQSGKCTPVCCNGLEGVSPDCEQVLIAGMGGEEIIAILKRAFVPESFVFQPMKNVASLRKYLLVSGAEITRDEVFESGGKYYFVLCGKKSGNNCEYTPAQLEFGKGDKAGALRGYILEEITKKKKYLERDLSNSSREKIARQIKLMEGFLSGEIN